MSEKSTFDIGCPKCGQKAKTEMWFSLNAQLNPEAKKKLLEGQINLFHCDNCGFETVVHSILIYHDMRNRFVVYYIPFRIVEEHFDMFTEDAEINLHLPEDIMNGAEYFKKIHYVFSIDELVRYVIFRDKLAQSNAK